MPKGRAQGVVRATPRRLGRSVPGGWARQKESTSEEGHLRSDPGHILISIPPTYGISQGVGYRKGKSAIYIARTFGGKVRKVVGEQCWARGYVVSTVGRDEQMSRQYIQPQEAEDKRLEQLQIFKQNSAPAWGAPQLAALSGSRW